MNTELRSTTSSTPPQQYPLSSVEGMSADEMAAELVAIQQLTVSKDPEERAQLTPERLRRAVRIVYFMNISRTGPKKTTRKKANESEELPSIESLSEDAPGLPSTADGLEL